MIEMETNQKLRIAVVTEAFLPQVNGVTNSVLRLLEYSKSQGHEVLIIAPESEGGPTSYLGYKIKHVPSIAMKKLIPMGVPRKFLEPLLEGFDPDVIHLASPIFLGHYVARIAKKMGIPTVSVYQTDIAGFARHYGLTIAHNTLKKWVSRIHQASDITLAPSKWACRDLESNGVKNVRIWKRGVDLVNFDPSRRDELLRANIVGKSEKLIIGYVGRLANEKRIDDLAILDQQRDIQLVIVGDGPAAARFKKELPNARFVGYQSGTELARYVASFDIFVHTGKHETFCQAIQESLAAGVPVIGPDSGGPVDLIDHGVTGLLIDTADSHALLEAVETLRAHSSFDLMKLAARRAVEHRTWDYINSQLIEHYRDAIHQVSKKKDLVA
ncbi:MAG: glycosyltransferase family 1 protein [Actinobacteria bacterium]|nr:glycosyltransferase family 1 protein [Actinomycetota bacterium]